MATRKVQVKESHTRTQAAYYKRRLFSFPLIGPNGNAVSHERYIISDYTYLTNIPKKRDKVRAKKLSFPKGYKLDRMINGRPLFVSIENPNKSFLGWADGVY